MNRFFLFMLYFLSSLNLSAQNFNITDTAFNVGDVYRIPPDKLSCFDYPQPYGTTTILDSIVNFMKTNSTLIIEIGGYTDSKGSYEYNIALSKKRAESVMEYFIKNGINETRLKTEGYGETKSVANNENPDGSDNPEGRQLNRRIELKILKVD